MKYRIREFFVHYYELYKLNLSYKVISGVYLTFFVVDNEEWEGESTLLSYNNGFKWFQCNPFPHRGTDINTRRQNWQSFLLINAIRLVFLELIFIHK